jgi:hypothetical protein
MNNKKGVRWGEETVKVRGKDLMEGRTGKKGTVTEKRAGLYRGFHDRVRPFSCAEHR